MTYKLFSFLFVSITTAAMPHLGNFLLPIIHMDSKNIAYIGKKSNCKKIAAYRKLHLIIFSLLDVE